MKVFLLGIFFISAFNFSFSQNNSKLLINEISENNSDSYILNTGNFIRFDNFSLDSPFLKVCNPFISNFIQYEKFKNTQNKILQLKPETKLIFNMAGSDNFADIFADFSSKRRYSYLNAKLSYFFIERYKTNRNSYFNENDVYFNLLNFKTFFSLFDESKHLNFYTENYYGNKSFPSMFKQNNLKRENNRWFGKYGFNFGTQNENFRFGGNFYYAMLNEDVSFSNKPDKYYSKYDNINLDMKFDFDISEKSATSVFFNYFDLQVSDFLFIENFIGRVSNERISTGFENTHKVYDNFHLKYGADISYSSINYRDVGYDHKNTFPDYRFQIDYLINKANNISVKFSQSSFPPFNMSDTVNKSISNTRIGAEYSLLMSGFDLVCGVYHNSLDGLSSFSIFDTEATEYIVKNMGLFFRISGDTKAFDYIVKYSLNDLNKKEVLFINYLANHNLFVSVNQNYDFGLKWELAANFRSGIKMFDPELSKYIDSDNYYLINIKLAYQIMKNIDIYLKANNITDSRFMHDFFFPAHNRSIIGGVAVSL